MFEISTRQLPVTDNINPMDEWFCYFLSSIIHNQKGGDAWNEV